MSAYFLPFDMYDPVPFDMYDPDISVFNKFLAIMIADIYMFHSLTVCDVLRPKSCSNSIKLDKN